MQSRSNLDQPRDVSLSKPERRANLLVNRINEISNQTIQNYEENAVG